MGVVWQDPPASRPRHPWNEIVRELSAHPGTWALVRQSVAPSTQYTLKRRGCEVRTANTGVPNKVNLYARWPVG